LPGQWKFACLLSDGVQKIESFRKIFFRLCCSEAAMQKTSYLKRAIPPLVKSLPLNASTDLFIIKT
jgi:hypothetical protein